jgi:GNAT superfamily N-acetyltransferase
MKTIGEDAMITCRRYNGPEDYQRISNFLIDHYQPENRDGNWLEPAWEYMHFHPALDSSALGRIGIWEENGEIVAVVNYESKLGEAFFQLHPDFKFLWPEMLAYAEQNLAGWSESEGKKYLNVYINDDRTEFQAVVTKRGYCKDESSARPMFQILNPAMVSPITLPEGFCLTSLAEECDWGKVNRVLWRGFNHPGEAPHSPEDLASRKKMFDTPKAKRELKIAVKAPNGEFAAFCGMFFEPVHRIAYVEPVATDPDFRRMGLGKAAVLEGIRRCGLMGATVAYVGSDQEFYQAIGFKRVYYSECWEKYI